MNAERRKAIGKLVDQIDKLKGQIEDIHNEADNLLSEEQDYFDNMPESFKNSDRGETAQAAIDALSQAVEELGSVDLDAAIDNLNEAMG
jgi:uncharacterized coiled-coil DUF342 family protein